MKKYAVLALLAIAMGSCKKNKNEANIYEVNSATSVAEWKGSAPDHTHTGAFRPTGYVSLGSDGKVREGDFVIPISSIENYDLPEPVEQQLLTHLKSPDFFNMVLHPNAAFRIIKAVPYNKTDTSAVAGANYLISGNFSMIGQTHAITFPAKISYTTDSLETEARFELDRTKWGMSSYTDPSKGLYVLPQVAIHLKVKAGRKRQ